MYKKALFSMLLSSSCFANTNQSMFDDFFTAYAHGPADEQVFFAAGTPDAWLDEKESQRPLWSGIGLGMQNNFIPSKKMCWLKPNLTLGPAIPDPRGSFVISLETPIVAQYKKSNSSAKISNLSGEVIGIQNTRSKAFLAQLRSFNAAITARGFFGPKVGFLKNFELVLQLAARIPWGDYVPRELNLTQADKTVANVKLRSRNAFLIGLNWHVVPPYLRVGVFYEAFSPRFYEKHFKDALSQSFKFAKNAASQGLRYVLKNNKPVAAAVTPEATSSEVQLAAAETTPVAPLAPSFEQTGLACLGSFAEMSLFKESVQLGVRVKQILPDVGSSFKTYISNPGMQELTVYLKTAALNNWSGKVDFPEVGLSFAMLRDTKTRAILNNYGINFKYRF